MKRFLTLIALALAVLSLNVVALAQDAGPQGGQIKQGRQNRARGGGMMRMRGQMMKEVLAQLNLNEAQKKQVAELDKKTQAQVKEVMEENQGDRKGTMQEMRQVMRAHHDGLEKILTKEQRKRFRELMMAKMKALREKRQQQQQQQGGAGQS